jgi:cyclopropane fatty-acyl-phospholipid synthase-like methyltransferase
MNQYADIVRKGYNQLASVYDKWAESVRTEERKKYLAKIDQCFADGSQILDIGCGNGLLNTRHLANKFNVIGIDVSERQIKVAQDNLPNVRFICADVREYDFEPGSLDGIVSFYCFNHIPRTSYETLFSKFHHWLRTNGLLIASFGTGDTKGWTGEWLGATMFFSSHNRQDTLSLIEHSGFKIEEETVETALEDGSEISFLWVIARNKKL